jgi:hypothetical protein
MRKLAGALILTVVWMTGQPIAADEAPEISVPSGADPCGNTPSGGVIYCFIGKDGKVQTTVGGAPTSGALLGPLEQYVLRSNMCRTCG